MRHLNLFFGFLLCSISLFAETPQRIVVFGDSLSDLGTYNAVAGPKGGGKFTTNPGKIWIEVVGDHLLLPVSANREEGFGLPLKLLGGFDYAQGGSRVSLASTSAADKGFTARPVMEQVEIFLTDEKQFQSSDIVFVLAGANDVLASLKEIMKGHLTPKGAVRFMNQTGSELSLYVQKIIANGATRVVVINLPMIEKTPESLLLTSSIQTLIARMTTAFNERLVMQLGANPNVQIVDLHSYDEFFDQNYMLLGFENVSRPACKITALPGHSSLFCTPETLVMPEAAQTYKFADGLHPSTGFSKLVGEFVWSKLEKNCKK